jgi:plasmid stabilization system protein ParE
VNYRIELRSELTADVAEVCRWYRRHQPDLAEDLFEKFFVAVRAVQASPGLFRILESDVRRIRLTRFPYHLYFRVMNDTVRFLLLMHTARSPEALKRELRKRPDPK